VQVGLDITGAVLDRAGDAVFNLGDALAELPSSATGLANDITSGLRGSFKTVGAIGSAVLKIAGVSFESAAKSIELDQEQQARSMEQAITQLGFSYEQAQTIYEYELASRELATAFYEIATREVRRARPATSAQGAFRPPRNLPPAQG
jgi:hypothetical protein